MASPQPATMIVELSPVDRELLRSLKEPEDAHIQPNVTRTGEAVIVDFPYGAILKVVGESAKWEYGGTGREGVAQVTTNQDRDARFELAKSLVTPDMTPEALATLRKFAGTARPLYRPGKNLWNWFFDTEYTSYPDPAPVSVAVATVLLLGCIAILAVVFL